MSAITEKIRAHYAGLPLGKIEVPEWGVTIHVRPATMGQSAAVLDQPDQFRQACKMIQIRARDAEGKPLFDDQDFDAMILYGEVTVINRVVDEIMALEPGAEDIKKP